MPLLPTCLSSVALQLLSPTSSLLLSPTSLLTSLSISSPSSISSSCLHLVTPAAVKATGFVASEQYRLCASSPCCLPSPC